MIPEPTEDGYEGFDCLAEKTNSWLVNQPPSITVINMQSVMVMTSEGKVNLLTKRVYQVTMNSNL